MTTEENKPLSDAQRVTLARLALKQLLADHIAMSRERLALGAANRCNQVWNELPIQAFAREVLELTKP